MVTTPDPSVNLRRRARERVIWVTDMVVAAVVTTCGVAMLFFTSNYVDESVRWPWAILLMGWLMLGGGALAFAGRLSRYWSIEMPGVIGASIGALLYAIILGVGVHTVGTSIVPVGMVVIAAAKLYHRYTELRIFVSEPGDEPFINLRVMELLRRKTANTVEREYY